VAVRIRRLRRRRRHHLLTGVSRCGVADLDVKQIVDQAAQTAGSADFGGDSWQEGLEHLVDALNNEAALNELGAAIVGGELANYLSDRAQITAYRAAHPELANADVVLIGEEPRLAPHRDAMRERLAGALGVRPELVAVRATTTDGLGFAGRGEGASAHAVVLVERD